MILRRCNLHENCNFVTCILVLTLEWIEYVSMNNQGITHYKQYQNLKPQTTQKKHYICINVVYGYCICHYHSAIQYVHLQGEHKGLAV